MSTVNSTFQFVSAPEAAALLGLTDARIRQLLSNGVIQGQKLGERNWAIHIDEVDRYKKERRPPGRPPASSGKA